MLRRDKNSSLPTRSLQFTLYLNFPTALRPWVWFNLWKKWVPGIFPGWGVRARPACEADNLIAVGCVKKNLEVSNCHNPVGLHGLLLRWFYVVLYYYTKSTSAHIMASMVCYWDGFTLYYIITRNQLPLISEMSSLRNILITSINMN
jgi:hypothetical protein